jgi:hypothetical protein
MEEVRVGRVARLGRGEGLDGARPVLACQQDGAEQRLRRGVLRIHPGGLAGIVLRLVEAALPKQDRGKAGERRHIARIDTQRLAILGDRRRHLADRALRVGVERQRGGGIRQRLQQAPGKRRRLARLVQAQQDRRQAVERIAVVRLRLEHGDEGVARRLQPIEQQQGVAEVGACRQVIGAGEHDLTQQRDGLVQIAAPQERGAGAVARLMRLRFPVDDVEIDPKRSVEISGAFARHRIVEGAGKAGCGGIVGRRR